NTKLLERRYYDYPPLTEAQRKEMEEEDIRLWQERARSGLLRGDAMLSSILSSLRQALGAVVSGTGSEYNSLEASASPPVPGASEGSCTSTRPSSARRSNKTPPGSRRSSGRMEPAASEA